MTFYPGYSSYKKPFLNLVKKFCIDDLIQSTIQKIELINERQNNGLDILKASRFKGSNCLFHCDLIPLLDELFRIKLYIPTHQFSRKETGDSSFSKVLNKWKILEHHTDKELLNASSSVLEIHYFLQRLSLTQFSYQLESTPESISRFLSIFDNEYVNELFDVKAIIAIYMVLEACSIGKVCYVDKESFYEVANKLNLNALNITAQKMYSHLEELAINIENKHLVKQTLETLPSEPGYTLFHRYTAIKYNDKIQCLSKNLLHHSLSLHPFHQAKNSSEAKVLSTAFEDYIESVLTHYGVRYSRPDVFSKSKRKAPDFEFQIEGMSFAAECKTNKLNKGILFSNKENYHSFIKDSVIKGVQQLLEQSKHSMLDYGFIVTYRSLYLPPPKLLLQNRFSEECDNLELNKIFIIEVDTLEKMIYCLQNNKEKVLEILEDCINCIEENDIHKPYSPAKALNELYFSLTEDISVPENRFEGFMKKFFGDRYPENSQLPGTAPAA